MKTEEVTLQQEPERDIEATGEATAAVDPPVGIDPGAEAQQSDGGHVQVDVLQLLARARAKQRHEKPTEDECQAYIDLWNHLDAEEQGALMEEITAASFHVGPDRTDEQKVETVVAGMLQKYPRMLEGIEQALSKGEDGGQDEQRPHLRMEKAAGEFRPIVRWLQARSIQEKVAAIAFSALINGDISRALQGRELYEGDIGQDLDADWEAAVQQLIETPETAEGVPPELALIAAYVLGLEAANY